MTEIAPKYKLIFVILIILTLMRCYSLASNIFGFGDGNEVRLFVFSDDGFTSDEIHNYEKLIYDSKNSLYQIVSVRDIKTTAVIENQTVDITIRNSPDKPFYNNYPYLQTEQKTVTSYSEIPDNCVIISEQISLYDAYGDHPYVTAYFHEPASMIFGDDIYDCVDCIWGCYIQKIYQILLDQVKQINTFGKENLYFARKRNTCHIELR